MSVCKICLNKGFKIIKEYDLEYKCKIEYVKRCSCEHGQKYSRYGSYADYLNKQKELEQIANDIFGGVHV